MVSVMSSALMIGSWDGSARVWKLKEDLSSGEVVAVLPNHENSVCVLGLPNGTIATGSAGFQSRKRLLQAVALFLI